MTEKLIQALHAGISRRDWHSTEVAANALRDALRSAPAPEWKEPPLTCPHIDAAIASGELSAEVKAELGMIRDINSQLRFGTWSLKAMLADAALALTPAGGEVMPWACVKCNSPRSINPCPKCGTALTRPSDGWTWPDLPDIDRIRELAREVGYAIGVHGSLERDLDLIAAPWVADAVGPLELAEHIAYGLGGNVVDFERQDKPCGRWACNIHTPGWTKMIDLSVMEPAAPSKVVELQRALRRIVEYPKAARDDDDMKIRMMAAIAIAALGETK